MATDPARITTPERTTEDADAALRPKSLDEFVGQQAARENLRIFVNAAKSRGEALDHVLFHGPPGLGRNLTIEAICSRLLVQLSLSFRLCSSISRTDGLMPQSVPETDNCFATNAFCFFTKHAHSIHGIR